MSAHSDSDYEPNPEDDPVFQNSIEDEECSYETEQHGEEAEVDAEVRGRTIASSTRTKWDEHATRVFRSALNVPNTCDIDALRNTWRRNTTPCPVINDPIALQVVEIDYTVRSRRIHPSPNECELWRKYRAIETPPSSACILRMFGLLRSGESALIRVHGFYPYFYVRSIGSWGRDAFYLLRTHLRPLYGDGIVVDVSECTCRSIRGYHPAINGDDDRFVQIIVAEPNMIPRIRQDLEENGHDGLKYESFEITEYPLRWMLDRNISGCGWLSLKENAWRCVVDEETKTSNTMYEIDVWHTGVVGHGAKNDFPMESPFRVLSFDIECQGRPNIFPDPLYDPVIQISLILRTEGNPSMQKVLFTLDTCDDIEGTCVISFAREEDLLDAIAIFFRDSDPDVLTGYNIINFDLAYLLSRAQELAVPNFVYLGRIKTERTRVKDTKKGSKQTGMRETKEISIPGRFKMDMLEKMRLEKFRSFSLNFVCSHFLKKQKEDVHHSEIAGLQSGTSATRRRLGIYCIKDSELVLELSDATKALSSTIALSVITGVPLRHITDRGQSVRVQQLIRSKGRTEPMRVVLPMALASAMDQHEDFKGATVIEPVKGFYEDPVATLDFASLYPSIMRAHNLCYSTAVSEEDAANFAEEEITRTPIGKTFVKQGVCHGILPKILSELTEERKQVKAQMKTARDNPQLYNILDSRQLALKVSSNSVYGFTGAGAGSMGGIGVAISASVTSFGRQMIDTTSNEVQQTYSKKNGYDHDAKVIYGDTDSVMICFGTKDVATTLKLGEQAAEQVTKCFKAPIKLEFEKVYHPYLLCNKKRYAGLYWTNPTAYDKLDCKGIELVRRDNCKLLGRLLNIALDHMLKKGTPRTAIPVIIENLVHLKHGTIDIADLVITKELTKTIEEYELSGTNQAHVECARLVRQRDPGSAYPVGSRVPFVMINGKKGDKAYLRAEDPTYVIKHGLQIDFKWYFDNQLTKPLERIYEHVLSPSELKELINGAHTRTSVAKIPVTSPLFQYGEVLCKCLRCGTPMTPPDTRPVNRKIPPKKYDLVASHFLPKHETPPTPVCRPRSPSLTDETSQEPIEKSHPEQEPQRPSHAEANRPLCDACRPFRIERLLEEQRTLAIKQQRFSRLWSQCQRCKGCATSDIQCTTIDCPIFYTREQARVALLSAQKKIARFDIEW